MTGISGKTAFLIKLLGEKDKTTLDHSVRVAGIAVLIAREMGIADRRPLDTIRNGNLLHDIGKIFIPDKILLKNGGPLMESEMRIMRMHSLIGREIVAAAIGNPAIEEIIYQHHEHLDGSGYPEGISGAAICPGARICSVADSFETIRFGRHHCPGRSLDDSIAEIRRHSGRGYDPEVVDALFRGVEEIERMFGPTTNPGD